MMVGRVCSFLQPLPAKLSSSPTPFRSFARYNSRIRVCEAARMKTGAADADADTDAQRPPKVIDSHLHVWASPQQAAEKYPYFPGQEPTLTGHVDFLLENMAEAGVDGALVVQPINHKFDHSYVTRWLMQMNICLSSVLEKYPSKFVGCCLANPAEDGGGIKQLENLITKDGYRAVRFNPYLWPSGQLMTNEVGKAMFSKAGELGVPVGIMCMKGLDLHLMEIEQLCTEFPSTVVLLDHVTFCKPPTNDNEAQLFSKLLNLSRFPQWPIQSVKKAIPIQRSIRYIIQTRFHLWCQPCHVGKRLSFRCLGVWLQGSKRSSLLSRPTSKLDNFSVGMDSGCNFSSHLQYLTVTIHLKEKCTINLSPLQE
ncbi:uncharacterized protein LOC142505883 isoform X1 [Primulina tabacum]|uniref:uncharacterized protein LOC142505883 isoform X1 n=2 Tax=Primulina tabacum TaxID=48773 RepID=UPI003F5A83E3